VQEEPAAEEGMLAATEYLDPKYAEKIMAESLSLEDDAASQSQRKGPGSETTTDAAAEPVVATEAGH